MSSSSNVLMVAYYVGDRVCILTPGRDHVLINASPPADVVSFGHIEDSLKLHFPWTEKNCVCSCGKYKS